MDPVMVSAGGWHAAVLGRDGRVCTWGCGRDGCLGHGTEEAEMAPKVVEGLKDVKAVHVVAAYYTTFVVSDNGEVYSFGCGESANLGQGDVDENTLDSKVGFIVEGEKRACGSCKFDKRSVLDRSYICNDRVRDTLCIWVWRYRRAW